MKIGFRKPSLKGRIAARTSFKRMWKSKARLPRGAGALRNPRKAAYNRVYKRTTRGVGCMMKKLIMASLLLVLRF